MGKNYLHLTKNVALGHSETKWAIQSISSYYYYLFSYCIAVNGDPFLGQFPSHCTVTKLNDGSCTNELITQVTTCFNSKCIQKNLLSFLVSQETRLFSLCQRPGRSHPSFGHIHNKQLSLRLTTESTAKNEPGYHTENYFGVQGSRGIASASPCSSPLGIPAMTFWALNVELPQAHLYFHLSRHDQDRARKSKRKVTYSVCKQHCIVFLEVSSKTLNMTI